MVIKMDNIEFLNYIYQNAHMGIIGIEHIEDNIVDDDLRKIILKQKQEYDEIVKETLEIFKNYHKEEKDISIMANIGSYMSAKFNLMKDNNTNVIAKMMIEGSNKGIIEITEKLNNYHGDNKELCTLAKKLLRTEEYNLEELKKFL